MGSDGSSFVSVTFSDLRTLLDRREELTRALLMSPYDMILYLDRARIHSKLSYFDLAAGDAYRALLLTQEVRNKRFKYHQEAIKSLQRYDEIPEVLRYGDPIKDFPDSHELALVASVRCFQMISLSLLLCGDLKNAFDYCQRGLLVSPINLNLNKLKDCIWSMGQRKLKRGVTDVADLPEWGVVRREIYPWNTHELDCQSKAPNYNPKDFETIKELRRNRFEESLHPDVRENDNADGDKGSEDREADASRYLSFLLDALVTAERCVIHPLDLAHIKPLWGDFTSSNANEIDTSPSAGPPPKWTLPFCFRYNIQLPLDSLQESGTDIYEKLDISETWIFNTFYAKMMPPGSERQSMRDWHSDSTHAQRLDLEDITKPAIAKRTRISQTHDSSPTKRARTSCDPSPTHCTDQDLRRYARDGGPDLASLRGVSSPTPGFSPSNATA